MAGKAAGVQEEVGEDSAAGDAWLASDVPQAVIDEVNALRRDPRGYAEELRSGAASSTAALKDCLRDLRNAAPMPELTLSPAICRACQQHMADMQASGRVSHLGADGSTPEARLSRVGDHREQCGENVALGARSAKGVVHHMLMNDGSVEHSQRANLLNPDFRFAGAAHAEHPTSGSVTVLLLTDHFKAKKAINANIQQERPEHLRVPPGQRAQVESMANPKLYGKLKVKVPQFPLGDVQPRPAVDPAVVRAFVHRADEDRDDLITEGDLQAISQRKQLGMSQDEFAQMFDEILQRRRAGERDRRAVDYAEIFASMQPHKRWVPVMDIHVERGTDTYQLIVDSEAFTRWGQELHDAFAETCEGLRSPKSRSEGKGPPRNGSAGVRIEEVNSFLASVLSATIQGAGTPLQQDPRVQQLLGRPGRGAEAEEEIRSAVCLGQRRLWAYRLHPHREAWLQLFRALDLHPLTSEGPAEQSPEMQASPQRSKNVARTPPRYHGVPAGTEKMTIRDAPEKITVTADKTARPMALQATTKLQPWQEKQQQIENSVNNCISLEGGDTTSPCVGFQAQRKFAQVLYMQKHGISPNECQQQQLDNEPDALEKELSLSGGAARRGLGGSAPPAGNRGLGAGSHSLMARNGVRSHFHNSASIHAKDGSHNGLSALDVRWEGSHIDHTKLSQASAPQGSPGWRTALREGDCAALKASTASSRMRDAEPYREWTQYDFRTDVPHRHGKHGRRHFDPNVREKPVNNRHFISEIENKPQEEYERHAERVQDHLHRKLPPGRDGHFQLCLPQSQMPSKYEELATHQPVHSVIAGKGVVKRHALGFGQMRHSGVGDPQLYTRPLGASQMDRLIPLAPLA